MAAILEIQNLTKKYGEKTAVDEVCFSIEQGEIFSLLGPNGAGKTSILLMLSGVTRPTRGDARIAGHSVVREPRLAKSQIGVVPQEIALYEALSARDNLFFWGRMYDMDGPALRQRVDEVLEIIGLSDRAGDRVETFSGGMKRRVNIGAGLLHQPQILFMDEPTVGIDPQSRRNILDSVKALNRAGLTVLYTTHYMEEAQELSDRVGILDHGRLIALGTQAELTQLVGQHETVRLRLEDGQPVETVSADLSALPAVVEASPAGDEVVVMVPDASSALPPILMRTAALNIRVRSVEIQEPNLEAVFLRLTGRALRDEG
ncbi:MAG TPA: ATP-binding cassette domain-containing protein [Anaerolineaceae bacterium]|nr:ATP-binding cassette domain-containing protein [Anaerolineaceae bacterium]